MTVRKIFANGKTFDVSGIGYTPEGKFYYYRYSPFRDRSAINKEDTEIGVLCNNAYLKQHTNNTWKIIGDPTEGAILSAAARWVSGRRNSKRLPFLSEIPFDSDRKKMSTIRNTPDSLLVCEKGAADVILKDCTKIYIEGEIRKLTETDIQTILNAENNNMAGAALRVLGIAFKTIRP